MQIVDGLGRRWRGNCDKVKLPTQPVVSVEVELWDVFGFPAGFPLRGVELDFAFVELVDGVARLGAEFKYASMSSEMLFESGDGVV